MTLRGPIDDAGLATIAAEEVARPLPPDRPLWRAIVVARESEEGSEPAAARTWAVALVLVMHHVLAEVDLATVRTTAKSQGATVNDCLLVAVAGAVEHLLHTHGERPDSQVVSVPISARRSTSSADRGNQVGVMPVRVDLRGDASARLARVAAETTARKSAPGSSLALVGPLFRGAAAVGAFGWFVNRQRLVNTFLTNLRGPSDSVHLAGTPVTRIVPVTITAGNVGVAFTALSYAGRLGVTVITDPYVVPEGEELARELDRQLAAIAG